MFVYRKANHQNTKNNFDVKPIDVVRPEIMDIRVFPKIGNPVPQKWMVNNKWKNPINPWMEFRGENPTIFGETSKYPTFRSDRGQAVPFHPNGSLGKSNHRYVWCMFKGAET